MLDTLVKWKTNWPTWN